VAAKGDEVAVKNLLAIGFDSDSAGTAVGNALVAACKYGRLSIVKILIRHDATLVDSRPERLCSAVEAAAPFNEILYWLSVGRHLDQKRVTTSQATATPDVPICHWSGIVQQPVDLNGAGAKRHDKSLKDYLVLLAEWKRDLRGKAAPPPATSDQPRFAVEKPGAALVSTGRMNLREEDIAWTIEFYVVKDEVIRK
jgi:hypothetical protein